jgi:ketosteroid isomerase-like protein
MLSWLAGKLIAHNMRRLREGDPSPTVRMYADDVRFVFPGRSSFAPGADNKRELTQWLERFASLGLKIYPDEVVLKGFPWHQTICVRGHIHLDDPVEGRVYDNRYVIWGHLTWGKMRAYEVYEDTGKSEALDAYLERRGKQPAASPP